MRVYLQVKLTPTNITASIIKSRRAVNNNNVEFTNPGKKGKFLVKQSLLSSFSLSSSQIDMSVPNNYTRLLRLSQMGIDNFWGL
jgi:hypothetical protein